MKTTPGDDLGPFCFNEAKVDHLRETLPGDDHLADVATSLKAIAHPARLAILRILDDQEGCVCDVAHTLRMPVSTASQHLKKLRDAGLLAVRPDGKMMVHRVIEAPLTRTVLDSLAGDEGSAA